LDVPLGNLSTFWEVLQRKQNVVACSLLDLPRMQMMQ